MQTTPTSYEDVPYCDAPYPGSHPDHLAAVAALAGLATEPVERCRVLELGCARGGNLIPMAFGLPRSDFVGIDSSPQQARAATDHAASLGLGNVTVEARSILDVDDGDGTFDYIICHGIYSWVPEDVRGKILAICARNLGPRGVAYVSYNTYPGWRMRGLVREMMGYATRHCDSPGERAGQARDFLEFMAKAATRFDRAYGGLLEAESGYLRGRPDSYLLHDHLEGVNAPVYFREFVERIEAEGLQYVSEVQGSFVAPEAIPGPVAEVLRRQSADRLDYEQLVDFLINRMFRQSVICRAGASLKESPGPEDLAGLLAGASKADLPASVPFRNRPLLSSAMSILAGSWPLPIPIDGLVASARSGVGVPAGMAGPGEAVDARDLKADLVRCYGLKLVEFHTRRPGFVSRIAERPVASRLARLQAATGEVVTNLRHEAGRLGGLGREVLRHLDGDHDRPALLGVLARSVNEGRLPPPGPGPGASPRPSSPGAASRDDLGAALDDCLGSLARFALLVA